MSAVLPGSAVHAQNSALVEMSRPGSAVTQRLEESRERMRQWLLDANLPAHRRKQAAAGASAGESHSLLDSLRAHPLAGVVIDAVDSWWANHPLRTVFVVSAAAAREVVGPVADKHPLALVLGAAAVGAIALRVRPWRWIIRPALFAGLVTQVASRLVSQIPLESVLDAFTQFASPRSERSEAAAATVPEREQERAEL